MNLLVQPVTTTQALGQITPLILTYNEVPNIRRTLDRLSWADRIVIVDSHSSDGTIEILEQYENVDVFYRKFDTFADQCNYGLSLIETEWVLSMDADYVLPISFPELLEQTITTPSADGFYVPFKFCVYGKALLGDNTTPRQVLYRRKLATYHNLGHQHRVRVNGSSAELDGFIYHDDRKSLSRWLSSQDRYLRIEAEKLSAASYGELDLADKIRKTKVLGPIVVLLYCLIVHRLLFQGWRGWYYALQRTLVETLLIIRQIETDGKLREDFNNFPDQA
ncbi:MAG: glycosyltransferase family 2 protein [Bacteroidota bacterium]